MRNVRKAWVATKKRQHTMVLKRTRIFVLAVNMVRLNVIFGIRYVPFKSVQIYLTRCKLLNIKV